MTGRRKWAALTLFVLVVRSAWGETTEEFFNSGVQALREGRPADAIAEFEALADRGVLRPELSYNRGLAYVARVRAGSELPGDLGQAAHGFEEARSLRGAKELKTDAEKALGLVRSEIARRRVQSGNAIELDEGVSFDRAIIDLLSENGWAMVAFFASCVLALALWVRERATDAHIKLGAAVTTVVSALSLAMIIVIIVRARDARLYEHSGIIVAASAHLADERRVVVSGIRSIPEGARVIIGENRAGWIQVRWGKLSGWLPVPTVRPLASL